MKVAVSVVGSVTNIKVFEDLKRELEDWDLVSVAHASDVSHSTIRYWMIGKTKKPRVDTIVKVAKAIGFELHLVQVTRPKLKIVK